MDASPEDRARLGVAVGDLADLAPLRVRSTAVPNRGAGVNRPSYASGTAAAKPRTNDATPLAGFTSPKTMTTCAASATQADRTSRPPIIAWTRAACEIFGRVGRSFKSTDHGVVASKTCLRRNNPAS